MAEEAAAGGSLRAVCVDRLDAQPVQHELMEELHRALLCGGERSS